MADQASKTAGKRTELHMARSMCWHCQSEVTGEYFCQQCVKVQPLSKELDYFTCLGLPRLLTIDERTIEARFYEMSRAFHPDFYQTKTDAEQGISLRNSALLNTAYKTLKDPIRRAEYLVQLEAGAAKDIRNTPPAELFEEILRGSGIQDSGQAHRASHGQEHVLALPIRSHGGILLPAVRQSTTAVQGAGLLYVLGTSAPAHD